MTSTTKVFVLGRFIRRICDGKISQAMTVGVRGPAPRPGKKFVLQRATGTGDRCGFARGLVSTSENCFVSIGGDEGDFIDFGSYRRVTRDSPDSAMDQVVAATGFDDWTDFRRFQLRAGRSRFTGYIIRWEALSLCADQGAMA